MCMCNFRIISCNSLTSYMFWSKFTFMSNKIQGLVPSWSHSLVQRKDKCFHNRWRAAAIKMWNQIRCKFHNYMSTSISPCTLALRLLFRFEIHVQVNQINKLNSSLGLVQVIVLAFYSLELWFGIQTGPWHRVLNPGNSQRGCSSRSDLAMT